MRTTTLFILRIPPPIGGGEIVSELLYKNLKINPQYKFRVFSRRYHNKSKQASNSPFAVFYGVKFIALSVSSIIFYRPKSIYIGLPKGFAAFIRNSVIIWFASLLGIKVFCELHGMSFPFVEKSNLKKRFLLFTLKKVTSIRVLAYSVMYYLRNLEYNGNIHVINNGVELPKIKGRNNKTSKLNILYLGAISKQKGFFRVLNIISILNMNNIDNIQLNIIGEWVHHSEKLEALKFIKNNKLEKFIIFHGLKTGIEKWRLIVQNQIMLHLTEFDGQPLTIIEAMGLGIPTIATKVGAIPEMIINDKNGFLINTDQDVIIIINKILSNDISLGKFKKNAIDTYNKKFTPSQMVINIISLINNNIYETTNPTT